MNLSKQNKIPKQLVKFKNIDEYHAMFPPEVQEQLEKLRKIIKESAPHAEETISYNMPAFKTSKVLVYYAAYKNHIGFYPTSQPITVFKEELTKYKTSKGAIQFPLNKSFPAALIKKIVKFRLSATEAEIDTKA